jgi:hypothetical protein
MRRTGSAPRSFWPLAAILLAFLTPAHAGTTEGEAWYRERIALPPEAVFEAVLLDVSRADAAGQDLARSRLEPAGHPPFRFKVDYDDEAGRPGAAIPCAPPSRSAAVPTFPRTAITPRSMAISQLAAIMHCLSALSENPAHFSGAEL